MGPCACSTATPRAASRGAAAETARLSDCAPCEPPNTSSTGASAGNPKCARASARSADRSRLVMVARTGMPTTSALGSPESGTALSTRLALRAPTLLAMPARALASWITTATRRRRRAAR